MGNYCIGKLKKDKIQYKKQLTHLTISQQNSAIGNNLKNSMSQSKPRIQNQSDSLSIKSKQQLEEYERQIAAIEVNAIAMLAAENKEDIAKLYTFVNQILIDRNYLDEKRNFEALKVATKILAYNNNNFQPTTEIGSKLLKQFQDLYHPNLNKAENENNNNIDQKNQNTNIQATELQQGEKGSGKKNNEQGMGQSASSYYTIEKQQSQISGSKFHSFISENKQQQQMQQQNRIKLNQQNELANMEEQGEEEQEEVKSLKQQLVVNENQNQNQIVHSDLIDVQIIQQDSDSSSSSNQDNKKDTYQIENNQHQAPQLDRLNTIFYSNIIENQDTNLVQEAQKSQSEQQSIEGTTMTTQLAQEITLIDFVEQILKWAEITLNNNQFSKQNKIESSLTQFELLERKKTYIRNFDDTPDLWTSKQQQQEQKYKQIKERLNQKQQYDSLVQQFKNKVKSELKTNTQQQQKLDTFFDYSNKLQQIYGYYNNYIIIFLELTDLNYDKTIKLLEDQKMRLKEN